MHRKDDWDYVRFAQRTTVCLFVCMYAHTFASIY